MRAFVDFVLSKAYAYRPATLASEAVELAVTHCINDVQYHRPGLKAEEIVQRIMSNQNELALFLYRLGRGIYEQNPRAEVLDAINWAMRECCACEVYFSNVIGAGFYIKHSVGLVIGSRNTIGEGFVIHQNCTVGHTRKGKKGACIGNNVTLFAGAQILGDLTIGDNVVIGSLACVLHDVPDESVCFGIPAKPKRNASIFSPSNSIESSQNPASV